MILSICVHIDSEVFAGDRYDDLATDIEEEKGSSFLAASSVSQTIQFISLLVCLFLSFSCSVFVLSLFNMVDDGLLS